MYVIDQAFGNNWAMYHGDCVQVMMGLPDNSMHFSVYSPPFRDLYTYNDSEADMGNSADIEEFLTHYEYCLKELYRITMPGRLTAVHVKDLPLYKSSSGWFGIEDFSGMVSWLHRRTGWVMHSRITIWKDPVVEMEKTDSHGLLHRNFVTRSQVCRTGLPDYLMVFVKPDPETMGKNVLQLRKPGDYIGTEPPPPHEYLSSRRTQKPDYYPGTLEEYNYSIAVWQRYASPVWFDVDPLTLNVQIARTDKDSKHLAPMQLDVARRAIDLWTNEGEIVVSPFSGVGTEPSTSVKMRRRGLGIELKRDYWVLGVKECERVEVKVAQPTMWDLLTTEDRPADPSATPSYRPVILDGEPMLMTPTEIEQAYADRRAASWSQTDTNDLGFSELVTAHEVAE